jgi:histidine ammonia-lyase
MSGVRPLVVETLCAMLEHGVTPVVPGKGSLGASGDLAPLAHIAAVAVNLDERAGFSGQASFEGQVVSGAEAMARAGIPRLELDAKEGLALTNGTTLMVAAAALAVADARSLVAHAEIAAALSFEGLLALTGPLEPALHEASRQPGQIATAERLRALLAGSRLVDSVPERVQDAYSLRCTPQVLGPVRDAITFLEQRVGAALNGVADNPLIVDTDGADGRALSGGNFHGQGPALWLDMLAIAIAEVASIAERRTFRLLTPELSEGLPSMLTPTSGLDSGLMMAQYTAAALVSDNKTLAHPDSVDSIPSSANQEDHVSMGANAARHALEVLDNVRSVIAIELLLACQAIDLRPDGPARLGRGTAAAYRAVRQAVAFLEHDRAISPDVEALDSLIRAGVLLEAVEAAIRS